jgi:hypothetical protein
LQDDNFRVPVGSHFKPALQNGAQGACSVFDLPTQQKLLYYDNNRTTLLGDFATCAWSNAGATGSGPQGIDFGGCYDSKRDRIYLGSSGYGPAGDQGKVFSYDVATNAWSAHANTAARSFGASNYSCVHYDSVNDRVVDIDHNYNNPTATVHVYNPETWSWEQDLPVPAGVSTAPCWHGFYSPALNAHFLYVAYDSDDKGTMWVYRYKALGSAAEKTAVSKTRLAMEAAPNPFRTSVTLNLRGTKGVERLDIFDVQGKNVKSVRGPVPGQLLWDAKGLPSGIYTVRVMAAAGTLSKNILLER